MTDQTVETIRRASALMRSRVAAASPSPWLADTAVEGDAVVWGAPKLHDGESRKFVGNIAAAVLPHEVRSDWTVMFDTQTANAEHIAGFQPSVGLAVADLLDSAADSYEHGDDTPFIGLVLSIALTYLQDHASVLVEQPVDPRKPSRPRRPSRAL
jgi:hypothetical protein